MADPITLDKLFQIVQLQYNALGRAFDAADGAAERTALLREMREFTHRLDLIQSLRVEQRTADLSGPVGELSASGLALNRSLGGLQSLNDWIRACAAFLGVVDQIIDGVKLI